MPDRIIRESICASETLNELTWFEEVFWYRLMVNCDDYGRFDARPAVLKSRLFPIRDSVTCKNVEKALNKLSTVGLVKTYVCDGKPYLQLVTWDKYQRVRAKRSKYPEPDNTCCQLTAIDGNSRRNPIQSNPNPCECAEAPKVPSVSQPGAVSTPPDRQPFITLTLNDKSEFPVYPDQIAEWAELYPSVNVEQALRSMRGWCMNNPKKRKTRQGILRFINNWLSNDQNKGMSQNESGKEKPVFAPVLPEPELTPEMDKHVLLVDPSKPFDLMDYLP